MGWSNPGSYVPEFEEAMNALKPGEISTPLVSRFGVHLIQLLERRETRLNPREQREMVRQMVRQKKIEDAYAVWVPRSSAMSAVTTPLSEPHPVALHAGAGR